MTLGRKPLLLILLFSAFLQVKAQDNETEASNLVVEVSKETLMELPLKGWGSPYQPPKNKKSGYYKRNAERDGKNGQHIEAGFQAVLAIKAAEKRGQLRRAQRTALEWYPLALSASSEKIKALTNIIAKADNPIAKVNNYDQLLSHYRTMKLLMAETATVAKEKTKMKKGESLSFTSVNYDSQIEETALGLSAARYEAAEYLYQKGLELEEKGGRVNYKNAAKSFRNVKTYVSEYKDCTEHYTECRKLGTTYIAFQNFENRHGIKNTGDLGSMLSSRLVNLSTSEEYEFLEFVDRSQIDLLVENQRINASGVTEGNSTESAVGALKKLHFIVTGSVTSVTSKTEEGKPSTSEKSKEIKVGEKTVKDSEGNEKKQEVKKTVTAKFTSYSKKMTVFVTGNYQITSVKTGQIVDSGKFTGEHTWFHQWGSYSGDARALSSWQKTLAENKNVAFPSLVSLVPDAHADLTSKAYQGILPFFKKVGR